MPQFSDVHCPPDCRRLFRGIGSDSDQCYALSGIKETVPVPARLVCAASRNSRLRSQKDCLPLRVAALTRAHQHVASQFS